MDQYGGDWGGVVVSSYHKKNSAAAPGCFSLYCICCGTISSYRVYLTKKTKLKHERDSSVLWSKCFGQTLFSFLLFFVYYYMKY